MEGSFCPFKGFSPAAPSPHSEGCQSPCRQEVNLLISSSFSHWHRWNFDNLVTVLNNLFKNPIAFNLFGGNLRRNFFEKNNTILQLQKLKEEKLLFLVQKRTTQNGVYFYCVLRFPPVSGLLEHSSDFLWRFICHVLSCPTTSRIFRGTTSRFRILSLKIRHFIQGCVPGSWRTFWDAWVSGVCPDHSVFYPE